MIYPKKLPLGGTIGLVCTSSPISEAEKRECVAVLSEMGYRVKCAGNLTKNCDGYMAGSGAERGWWLNRMFADSEVDAIFCARGGNGSSRMMEYIDTDLVRRHPKIFMGYSDVTNLLLLLTQQCQLVTFHGPMVLSNMVKGFDLPSKRAMYAAINGDKVYTFQNPTGIPIRTMKHGCVSAPVIGGNLSLLSASMGTPYEVDTAGNILFMEEVHEPITKVEKWAYHLRNAGKLDACAGIILGQFTDITNKVMPTYDVTCCFREILKGLDIPVMYHVQSGHGRSMMTIPFGAMCHMDTDHRTLGFEIRRGAEERKDILPDE